MKNTVKLLALGAALAASVTIAKADTIETGSNISVTGDNFMFNGNTGTLYFAANGSTAGNYQVGSTSGPTPGSTGTFGQYFTTGNPVTFFPTESTTLVNGTPYYVIPLGSMSSHMPPGGSLEVLTTTENNETLSFYLTSETWSTYTDPTGQYTDLSVTGDGYFTLNGVVTYTNEVASFNFTPQQPLGNVTATVTFSGTGTALGPVPEPSSLALLGTSLVGAAMAARRRFSRMNS